MRNMAIPMLHRNIFLCAAFETPETKRKSAQCLTFSQRPTITMRIARRM
jgi:hypothetical protein